MSKIDPIPPKRAQQFFSWYCRNELQDSILGDLDERFYQQVEKHGPFKAKFNYWLGVLKFINRHTLRRDSKSSKVSSNHVSLFRNNLLSSFRFLSRNKRHTFINIVGLTLGFTSCLLIFLFLLHETSFDQFHSGHENIYRIVTNYKDNSGKINKLVNTPPALAPGIRGSFPELNKITQLRYTLRSLLRNGDLSFYEDHGFYADSLFLEIFDFELTSGDRFTALDDPNSIVMTEALASKFFNDSNPIGSFITLNNDVSLKVTGILKSIPSNSHLNFDFLVSFSTYVVPEGYVSDLHSWSWLGFLTYAELNEQSSQSGFEEKLNQLYLEKTPNGRTPFQAKTQKLKNIYMESNEYVDDLASHIRTGNIFNVYTLGIIALLILLIACFNFMNLTTAISVNRGKDIGVRKVLGAGKTTLILQLLTESVLIAFLSLVLAYCLGISIFPYLKQVLEWGFNPNALDILSTVPYGLAIALLMGLTAGIYPAILLSGFNTISSLKGKLKLGKGTASKIKYTLVIFQFCISIALISSTIIITRQINHIKNQSLGFDRENVIIVKLLPQDMSRYFETYKNMLLQNSDILAVTLSERAMGDPWPINGIRVDGQDESQSMIVNGNQVGYDFLKTMAIPLKTGRSFSESFIQDSIHSIIITEKTAKSLGLKDPIGKKLHFFNLDGPRTVIGVTEDFNYSSLHNEIGPAVMILPFIDLEYLYIRISPGNIIDKIAMLENIWDKVNPSTPLEIHFMDDQLNELYKSEIKLSYLISCFSILAIILACLGLYGLVSSMVNNRIKEVGVRKVLGAPLYSLILLFSGQFILMVILSLLITAPVLQYLLNNWLADFAYRIEIGWWTYILSAFILMTIAMSSISYQSISAAMTNPSKILRSE